MGMLKTKPRELSKYIHLLYKKPYYGSLFMMAGLDEMWGYVNKERMDELLKECAFIQERLRYQKWLDTLDKDDPRRKTILNIGEAHIHNGGGLVKASGEVEITLGKGTLSNLRTGIELQSNGDQKMGPSKINIGNINAKNVGEVIASSQPVEVNIANGSFDSVNKVVHLYFEKENDPELEAAFERAPEHIKEEFYKEMSSTSKEGWFEKIKHLKLSTYLSSTEKIADVSMKLYNLWDKIKDIKFS